MLIAALRSRASTLSPEAMAIAEQLKQHATTLERRGSSHDALLKFNAFAQHYKGPYDLPVPGLSEAEWGTFVQSVRRLSRTVVREQGLDASLLGRIHSFLHGRANR